MLGQFFNVVLYRPLFNGFVALYNIIPDVGIVILIITIIIKLVLYPLTQSSIKSQKALNDLQPKMEEIKRKYKDNQQQLAAETMKLYKENKVNPFASCLPLLIQMPILIALCYVLRSGLASNNFDLLYSFVKNPEHINTLSLGFIDLSKRSVIFAFLAGGSQFLQTKMMMRKKAPAVAGAGAKDENMMAMMNKQMLYFMPILTVFIGFQLPGGLTLYWFLSTLFTTLQQLIIFKKKNNTLAGNIIEGKVE
ncbi:MAG TPA: YidC/Oxa1 family membrane protein insertase [Candidatus Magasanikbacteria bacterium]|jgi:YidC/Oxa1 family membrane protein insertase|nr:YidC/Oxa1 family membrane protein insertase [Candidatus Magasanikbacteria bacterium]HQL52950.1 YidC/Oxa1 family membrane protein insertase [Candidatus Magasanikbacteria bacterium]